MNTKRTDSKKTVRIALDGDAQRTLTEACRALSEVAAASIQVSDNARAHQRG